MAKSPFSFKILSLLFWREKKNLSPNFGVMVFFLDLVDFQSTRLWDFSSLFFDKRPLNVGRHVERLEIVFMAVCGMFVDS